MPKEKTFHNIAEMSEEFRKKAQAVFDAEKIFDPKTFAHLGLVVWQIHAQMAIAQQLSVISGHLADISNALGLISANAGKR